MRMGWVGALVAALGLMGCAAGDSPTTRDGSVLDGGPTRVDAGRRDAGRDAGSRVDTGVDAGPTDLVPLCGTCVADAQCGSAGRCGPLSDGERVCLRLCEPEFEDCPRGFQCAAYAPLGFEHVCLPVGEVCCIDEDADGYGVGGACLGDDCDDDDAERHPDAAELCDGADQDCDESVDEMFVDCAAPGCGAVGSGDFQEAGAGGCADGACTLPTPSSCGTYACEEGGESGDVCATLCDPDGADDDLFCAVSAHCDDGGCEPDFADGGVCDEDSDCASGNCENGFCCGAGLTCCNTSSDCPGYPGEGTVCDVPEDCEGSRGVVQCNTTTFACETLSGVADDSACDGDVLGDACGFYADVMCSGEVDQERPRCPSGCSADDECDANAHCDLGVCFPDLPDGEVCDEASDCTSGHCQNGFCCSGGDCCRTASDCPGGYGSPASCNDERACQGTRDAAVCISNRCDTQVDVEDDSACTSAIVADACGLYPSVRCTGAVGQSAPACPASCVSDTDCDENAHCDGGLCVLDQPNGTACDEPSDCTSAHCGNGFCCSGGDCCSRASDCPASYARASECLAATTCQGTRRDAVCNMTSFTCQVGDPIDDDSGCAGLASNDCGLFPGVSCTSMTDQPADQGGLCDMACESDAECDAGAFCNAMGTCQSRGMQGDGCTASNQCAGSLTCVDNVCCTSSCTGLCEACDVAGSRGTCAPVPAGTDPRGECLGIDCGSWFAGFSGDTCYERADAPSGAVDCNGARACETAAQVCPSQPVGDARLTCNALCQDPRGSTCTGQTPPVCDSVNAGTHTCGTGQCRRTVARCVSGAPNACVPGNPSAESCNDLDDDCDGTADNNITSGVSSYEPNNACGEVKALASVDTDGATADRTGAASAQIYYDGDVDYFRVYVDEEGGADCGFTCVDNERSTLTVTLTVPSGVGSMELCGVRTTCSNVNTTSDCITVTGGNSGTRTFYGRSRCCSGIFCESDNSEYFYLRVSGVAAPRWECTSYRLDYSGDEAC